VGFDSEILGNTWWAFKPKSMTGDHEKALLLWLNSSPALLLYFGRRVVTRSAWMQMKQPGWASMPVLDVHSLSSSQINALAAAYDSLSTQGLEPLARLNSDTVRCQIDREIAQALQVPDFGFIRELLDREPGMNAIDIAPRAEQPTQEIEEDEDDTQSSLPMDDAE
jgi:hypothetical protein